MELFFESIQKVFNCNYEFYQDEEIGQYKNHLNLTKNEKWRKRLSKGDMVKVHEERNFSEKMHFAEDRGPFLFGW